MKKNAIIYTFVFFSSLAGMAGTAAALPPDQQVEFHIYSDPSDPASPILAQINLALTAESTSGSHLIGWRITSAIFTRPTDRHVDLWSTGELSTDDSVDGLWWVEHSDPEAPNTLEFAGALPSISGSASSESIGPGDLNFELAGTASSASYSFLVSGEQYAFAEADDVPVEVVDPVFE